MLLILLSCGSSLNLWTKGDLQPPELIETNVIDKNVIYMKYNEKISPEGVSIDISKNISISSIDINDSTIYIRTKQTLIAGEKYTLTVEASDMVHNSMLSVKTIVGFNSNVPEVLINEIICEGSKTRPDKVELIVLSDGSLAGLALHQGGAVTYGKQISFPNIEVKAGDFIIVHAAPKAGEPATTETLNKTESHHSQASDTAWDIFILDKTQQKLSNTNASISLVNLSNNTILDAVIYSTRNDDINHKYKGFYRSSILAWAEEIVQAGAWTIGDIARGVFPSDGVNPKDSTSTRSIGRDSSSKDTNSKKDWYISASRKSSFGAVNSDDVYSKK